MFDKDPNSFGLVQWLMLLFISAWRGAVRYIIDIRKNNTAWSWVNALMQVVVSGFAGLLGGLGAIESGASEYMIMISSGVAGAMGTMALDFFWLKYTGVKSDKIK